MSPNLGYDDLRVDTVRQVAKLMAGAAITAPKSGGQPFLAAGRNFMETVIVDDTGELHRITGDAFAEAAPIGIPVADR
jgi:hypothetical protein